MPNYLFEVPYLTWHKRELPLPRRISPWRSKIGRADDFNGEDEELGEGRREGIITNSMMEREERGADDGEQTNGEDGEVREGNR